MKLAGLCCNDFDTYTRCLPWHETQISEHQQVPSSPEEKTQDNRLYTGETFHRVIMKKKNSLHLEANYIFNNAHIKVQRALMH